MWFWSLNCQFEWGFSPSLWVPGHSGICPNSVVDPAPSMLALVPSTRHLTGLPEGVPSARQHMPCHPPWSRHVARLHQWDGQTKETLFPSTSSFCSDAAVVNGATVLIPSTAIGLHCGKTLWSTTRSSPEGLSGNTGSANTSAAGRGVFLDGPEQEDLSRKHYPSADLQPD